MNVTQHEKRGVWKGVIEIPRPEVHKEGNMPAFTGSETHYGVLRSPALGDGALRHTIGVPVGSLGWIVPGQFTFKVTATTHATWDASAVHLQEGGGKEIKTG